jgi:uncharacterized protein
MKIPMDENIRTFLEQQTCLTFSTCRGAIPHSAHCFYVFSPLKNSLIFKSDAGTRHMLNAIENRHVAGTINPDRLQINRIRGIQFQGLLSNTEVHISDEDDKLYYIKFPYAKTFAGELWHIQILHLKMTDNTLRFGQKLEWEPLL